MGVEGSGGGVFSTMDESSAITSSCGSGNRGEPNSGPDSDVDGLVGELQAGRPAGEIVLTSGCRQLGLLRSGSTAWPGFATMIVYEDMEVSVLKEHP